LQTRIPPGSKVLLCTTTNRAIDSLAEKIHACGHSNVLAFGNAARLGPTSLSLTLPKHVERHASMKKYKGLSRLSTRIQRRWDKTMKVAEEVSSTAVQNGHIKSLLSAVLDFIFSRPQESAEQVLARLLREEQDEWKKRLAALRVAVTQFLDLPEHPPNLAQYLAGAVLNLHA
jgi:hypothetical protein